MQVQFIITSGYDRTPLATVIPMLTKIIVVALLLAILATLFSSVFFLVKDESSKRRTLKLLKLRVALSVTLVIFVVVAYYMGWIQPHAGPALHQ